MNVHVEVLKGFGLGSVVIEEFVGIVEEVTSFSDNILQ